MPLRHVSTRTFLKTLIAGLTACLGWFGLADASVRAQGVLIPQHPDRPGIPRPPRPVPLPPTLEIKSVRITVTIKNQVARTHVEQVFLNKSPYVLEGTYCFPIPESAALSEFAIWEGDKRLVGEVVERAKARQIYDQIVRTMRDPGLLEYVGKDLFQASIFPIPANGEKKLELAYSQVLKAENGNLHYRYPLAGGQRMMQSRPGQVVGRVEIDSPVPIKTIYSPSHAVETNRDGERKARLSFEVERDKAFEDFHLYYGLGEKDFGLNLLTHREPGKDGYFLILAAPKTNVSERERQPKDIVFVFDTSGSMSGEKIQKAQNALKFGLRSLGERDRFNVIRFSGEEHLFESSLVFASSPIIEKAVKFVDDFRAEGGTNIHDALLAGLKSFDPTSENVKMLVFMTDGLPTVGTTDARAIDEAVRKGNQAGIRIFTFGVGYDVNTVLLDKLAEANRGASDYVEPKEDLEVKVSNFFGRVNYPMLSDIKLDFGGVPVEYLYPKTLPDLFRGEQLILVGRYRGDADRRVTLRLSGKLQGKEQTFGYEEQLFARTESDNSFLPKLWATRRVGALMEQIRLNGENKELVDEIVSLGTRHGIVTPYTSYLATETNQPPVILQSSGVRLSEPRRDAPASRRPGDVNDEVVKSRTSGGARPAAPSGEGAVRESKKTAGLRDADKAERLETKSVKTVGTKTFYLIDGVWTDADFKPDSKLPTVEVTFGTDAYFELLKQKPALADYFALGLKVTVVLDGKVYRSVE